MLNDFERVSSLSQIDIFCFCYFDNDIQAREGVRAISCIYTGSSKMEI